MVKVKEWYYYEAYGQYDLMFCTKYIKFKHKSKNSYLIISKHSPRLILECENMRLQQIESCIAYYESIIKDFDEGRATD